MDVNLISAEVTSQVFAVWFLIGAALVFFMQAGFAMVETGFTRAKNAANIIMKNLMDFCIGVPMFVFIGFGLLLGEDCMGLIGKPGFDIFTSYANFDWSSFVFNMVFCATTATIVSGAMAERTKFLSYCVYSAIISALIYPIEAHWIWGGGWLSQMGVHDFAGSCAIHMVGGISAIIGAKILGPRIGKFVKDKNGKVTKVNAIPGHSLTLGALGCFILWFGWYGFNGAAATSKEQLGSIFLTTTIAPSVATVVCMIFTWIKYKKPDVSMCLNASLAGLVGITAGCDVMDAFGATMVGVVSGLLVVFGVWLLDHVLYIDDPVGAVAVHMMNGIWGTFAVGLFATTSAPGNDNMTGLLYGGGAGFFGTQCLGIVSVALWTAVTITITFFVIKATIGLRASVEEETRGLDVTEHGLASSYADFMPVINTNAINVFTGETTSKTVPAAAPASKKGKKAAPVSSDEAVPVQVLTSSSDVVASDVRLSKVDIICKLGKFDDLKAALNNIGVTGITVSNVSGCGTQKGETVPMYRGAQVDMTLLPKIKVEVVVSTVPVAAVVAAAKTALYTGNIGDGKIFVYSVENVIKVRTGEEGVAALQGSDD